MEIQQLSRWVPVPDTTFKTAPESSDKRIFDFISDIKDKAKKCIDEFRDEDAWSKDVIRPLLMWEALD